MHSLVTGKCNMNNNLYSYLSSDRGEGKEGLLVQAPGLWNSKCALI